MIRFITITMLVLASCTPTEQPISLRPCDPTLGTSSSDGGSSTIGSPIICPTIVDGNVAFEMDAATRTVYFDGVSEATGTGPAVLGLHGTYESLPSWTTYNPGYDLATMAVAQGGVFIGLVADPAAQADGEPFPWWSVCGIGGTSCDRTDDYDALEIATACAIEQGLADPDRVVIGGMSAGAILASLAIERGLGSVSIAAVTSWSGGTPPQFQPTLPASPSTSVFALHGGPNDVYCGIGQPAGSCNGYTPYAFAAPSEQLATDVDAAGGFAFVCNHGAGHSGTMGGQGAEFLAVARSDTPHPWIGFPFGVDGYNQWPQMSGGTNWMLRFYGDCHDPL